MPAPDAAAGDLKKGELRAEQKIRLAREKLAIAPPGLFNDTTGHDLAFSSC